VMHPDQGMGVEFTQSTPQHRKAVEDLLHLLTENRDLQPELLVEPEGLDVSGDEPRTRGSDTDDPLLQLFYGESLSVDAFQDALRRQRALTVPAPKSSASAAHV
jgi:hypothetical protein